MALEDLAESLGYAVGGEDEGFVFVKDVRDGDPHSGYGGSEIDESFVGDHQLGAVEFDKAYLNCPLDIFVGECDGDQRRFPGLDQ